MKSDRHFIGFDGESDRNNRYILLSAFDSDNTGAAIVNRDRGLGLQECLKFLTRTDWIGSICVWFSMSFDVNMIFRQIKAIAFWQGKRPIKIGRYKISYQPGKWLKITIGKKTFTHFDTFGFFQVSFKQTIERWLGNSDPIINAGKANRHNWGAWSIEQIKEYNRRECMLLAQVMNKIDQTLIDLPKPIRLRSWHGAGAISGAYLRSIGFGQEVSGSLIPEDVEYLASIAYFGGRIEMIRRGHFSNIWHGDLRSAYPSAMLELPDLSRCLWRRVDRFVPNKIGIYAIKFRSDPSNTIGALPYRHSNGAVVYPTDGAGAYWSSEIEAAIKHGIKIEVMIGWVIDKFYPSILRDEVKELYNVRSGYRDRGQVQEQAVKLVLNSIYGKIAQRPARRSTYYGSTIRSIALAGMITAKTRSILYDVAMQDPGSVIGFATDGLYTTSPRRVAIGDRLQQWDVEMIPRGLFIQSGFYQFKHEDRSIEIKTRGFHSHEVNISNILHDLKTRHESKIKTDRFITCLLALTEPGLYGGQGATWQTVNKVIRDEDYKRVWRSSWGSRGFDQSIPASAAFVFSSAYNPKLYDWQSDPIDLGGLQ